MPKGWTWLLVASLLPLSSVAADSVPRPAVVVIVHPSNPVTSVERKFLENAFLKKTTRWSDDRIITPADGLASSPVRQRFTHDVMGRTVSAVKSYWQQIIFSGRGVPPPEFESDAAIVRYVLRNAGAIGYVSGSADIAGAKLVVVR